MQALIRLDLLQRLNGTDLTLIKLDASQISDWDTFHDVLARAFGFPEFYGRNMNAWIDCMTWLDVIEDGMTSVCVAPGQLLCLQIEGR
jgi:Barstar (barnase inhibitor)